MRVVAWTEKTYESECALIEKCQSALALSMISLKF